MATINQDDIAANGTAPPANKVAIQMKKMRDANAKYKDLLKMAKERIQSQEEDLKRLRGMGLFDGVVFCFFRLIYLTRCSCYSRVGGL